MFWWIVGIGIAALIIINAVAKKPKPKPRQPARTPSCSRPAARKAIAAPDKKAATYATREINGRDEALSLQDVEALFAPLKKAAAEHKRRLASAVKIATAYERTGELRAENLSEIKTLEMEAKANAHAAERLNDEIYLIRDSAVDRWWKVFEDLDTTHSEVEDCLDEIATTRQMIVDGEHEPERSTKKMSRKR